MSMEPPPFEESSRCNVCKCSFTPFRRRHHCRCCGQTLCAEHSSIQMALPQFGIYSGVRVCAQCFNNASRSKKDDTPAFSNGVNAVTDSVSRLDMNVVAVTKSESTAEKLPVPGILECKCGMPLCICEAPAPRMDSVSLQVQTTSVPTVQSIPKPKKADPTPKSRGSTSNSKSSTIFNLGQATNNSLDRSSTDYDVSGEGLREAIKNGDTASAKKLLSQGVDANYCDKQGSSLLHLAAVFNQTEIAFALMDHGASMVCKNLQGETPLDCAPATLQYRMKKKMEESVRVDP
ncbi:hepatocyte growth factor-regulated tyrosine kinase substrate-like isoform X2 [Olea europaea var. sylvestris]|uniref:Hepatocyte growth factor-regulated tyrosine kinase substrate n=1 Tax=Olea europaea subsp. europaea TaxID=158383 RepID=A0A8S0TTH1_OLEEU|nr:hepatocyte growth factor-regulated tyrosine kinase substrate-like isoform X2 [Olea europaea var. sylvestris]CAA3009419.1 hepatocyte growth factor-regulated tyrosine kinase substrate [Olea europaea subsp. europaea]